MGIGSADRGLRPSRGASLFFVSINIFNLFRDCYRSGIKNNITQAAHAAIAWYESLENLQYSRPQWYFVPINICSRKEGDVERVVFILVGLDCLAVRISSRPRTAESNINILIYSKLVVNDEIKELND